MPERSEGRDPAPGAVDSPPVSEPAVEGLATALAKVVSLENSRSAASAVPQGFGASTAALASAMLRLRQEDIDLTKEQATLSSSVVQAMKAMEAQATVGSMVEVGSIVPPRGVEDLQDRWDAWSGGDHAVAYVISADVCGYLCKGSLQGAVHPS